MKLTIVRGLPGSGKTYKAKQLIADYNRELEQAVHIEADMFHMGKGGYDYKSHLASYAHQYCESNSAYFLNQGFNVVVANTFITKRSVIAYYELSLTMGVEFEIINCDGDYESVHEVPVEVLARMSEFKEIFTTDDFLCYYKEYIDDIDDMFQQEVKE